MCIHNAWVNALLRLREYPCTDVEAVCLLVAGYPHTRHAARTLAPKRATIVNKCVLRTRPRGVEFSLYFDSYAAVYGI